MIHHPQMSEHMKQAGDIAATTGAAVITVSHWAEIMTPILTLLIALVTLAWWIMRFIERAGGE